MTNFYFYLCTYFSTFCNLMISFYFLNLVYSGILGILRISNSILAFFCYFQPHLCSWFWTWWQIPIIWLSRWNSYGMVFGKPFWVQSRRKNLTQSWPYLWFKIQRRQCINSSRAWWNELSTCKETYSLDRQKRHILLHEYFWLHCRLGYMLPDQNL